MMRRSALGLLVAVTLALPLRAEPLRDFDTVMAALDVPLSQGDMGAAFVLLSRALRDARVGGWLTPDWAIFFAMQADFARLDRGNPAYALQLTEDGLELIAGNPAQVDFSTALNVSRAYALADLGRFDEAARAARLALPDFRRAFGGADADDLAARADLWAKGELTDYNTAATDLSRQALERAYAASAEGAHGRAILLAAGAVLPLDTDLPEAEVRSIDFEAEILIADSLARMGRIGDSVRASRRALNHLTRQPWAPGQPIEWWQADWADAEARVIFTSLSELALRAVNAGETELGTAALREAASFAADSEARGLLLVLQASLAFRGGDAEAALGLIAESRAVAVAADDHPVMAMSDFYSAIVQARQTLGDDRPVDPAPLIAATEAALTLGAQQGGIDRQLVLADAARVLSETDAYDTALRYAREALRTRQDGFADSRDTAYAATQTRIGARGVIESFLKSANAAAGGLDPARGEACPPTPGFQSCVVVARRR